MKEVSKIGVNSRSADDALNNAMGQCKDVLVLGWDNDGFLHTYASTGLSKQGEANMIVDVFKLDMLMGAMSDES